MLRPAHDQYEDTKNETDFSFLPIHYLKHYKQTKITDMPHPNYYKNKKLAR